MSNFWKLPFLEDSQCFLIASVVTPLILVLELQDLIYRSLKFDAKFSLQSRQVDKDHFSSGTLQGSLRSQRWMFRQVDSLQGISHSPMKNIDTEESPSLAEVSQSKDKSCFLDGYHSSLHKLPKSFSINSSIFSQDSPRFEKPTLYTLARYAGVFQEDSCIKDSRRFPIIILL